MHWQAPYSISVADKCCLQHAWIYSHSQLLHDTAHQTYTASIWATYIHNACQSVNRQLGDNRYALTKRVIWIDVGVGNIPAADHAIHASTVTRFTCWTHGETQHRAFVCPECVDRLYIQRRCPVWHTSQHRTISQQINININWLHVPVTVGQALSTVLFTRTTQLEVTVKSWSN